MKLNLNKKIREGKEHKAVLKEQLAEKAREIEILRKQNTELQSQVSENEFKQSVSDQRSKLQIENLRKILNTLKKISNDSYQRKLFGQRQLARVTTVKKIERTADSIQKMIDSSEFMFQSKINESFCKRNFNKSRENSSKKGENTEEKLDFISQQFKIYDNSSKIQRDSQMNLNQNIYGKQEKFQKQKIIQQSSPQKETEQDIKKFGNSNSNRNNSKQINEYFFQKNSKQSQSCIKSNTNFSMEDSVI